MRKKPSDSDFTDEQWKAIVLSGKNIIVSAGAGSGKTAVLTTRIIEKIKEGVHIDELIVLTFTEAAAFEMKNRVRKALKEQSSSDKKLLDELANIDRAMITTFDSFSLALLKKYHYLLQMDDNIAIADNIVIERKKREILDSVFDEFYESNKSFYDFLNTFTLKDDEDVKKSLLELSDKLNVLYDREKFYDTYIDKYFNEDKIKCYINEYEEMLECEKNIILKSIGLLDNEIESDVLRKWYEEFSILKDIAEVHTYDEFKSFMNSYKLKSLTTSKKITEDKSLIEAIYSKIKTAFNKIKELTVYESETKMIKRYLDTKDTITLFLDILRRFDLRLDEYKKKHNIFEFADITRLSIKILEENKDVLDEIKYKTKEIMIDEYQDTNDIGDYLISLISNNNIYMVGDIKQSIYGFRNANSKIFEDKYRKYYDNVEGYKIDLNKNFRSRSEVLTAINFIFEKIMDISCGGAEYKNGHEMIFGNMKYENEGKTKDDYRLELLDYPYEKSLFRKEEIEAFLIARDIEKKMKANFEIMNKDGSVRKMKYSDICILMDRKTDFDLYKKIFTYLNIPLTIHKDEAFVLSDEIFTIHSILNLLLCKKDRKYKEKYEKHATISLARSFLFSYTDDDIFKVFSGDFSKNKEIYLTEMEDKINYVWSFVPYLSLSSLLKKIYEVFDIYNKINRIGNVEIVTKKLDYLITVAKTSEEASYTLEDFASYFEDAMNLKIDVQFSNKETESDSVNIMTIHKSKGLEFPLLYCSGLYKTFSKEDIKSRYLYSKDYGLIVPSFDEGICYSFIKDLFKEKHQIEDIGEKLRLFYVALTRAREKIILVGNFSDNKKEYEIINNEVSLNSKKTYTSFYDIICSIKKYLKPYLKNISLEELKLTKDYEIGEEDKYFEGNEQTLGTEKKINITKNIISESHYSMESHITSKEEKEVMNIGTKIHEYLEYLDFDHIEKDFEEYEIPEFYRVKIRKFLTSPWFSDDIVNLYKEYEFMFEDYGEIHRGIIDLLIEKEDKLIIVDYKLKHVEKEEYYNQIRGYMEYLKRLSSKKIEGYLYSILDERYIEV